MKNKLIFIACAIVWAVGIAVLLFSCSASRSTGITIVPVAIKSNDYDSILKIQNSGKLIIDSGRVVVGAFMPVNKLDTVYPLWRNIDTAWKHQRQLSELEKLLKEFHENEWKQYNPMDSVHYLTLPLNNPCIGKYADKFIGGNVWNYMDTKPDNGSWQYAITSDGSDCDTCSHIFTISGGSLFPIKTISGNVIIGKVSFINGNDSNCRKNNGIESEIYDLIDGKTDRLIP